MKKYRKTAIAALLSAGLMLGVGVQTANAGEIHDGRLVAAWSYSWTRSSASAYSASAAHFCYAQQDGHKLIVNGAAGKNISATASGSASNHNDDARAGYGYR